MWIFITITSLTLIIITWAIVIYNKLVTKKQMVQEGWSGIDVQLKRRTNLIPSLIETVKGYMGHEKRVLEAVTAMRTKSQKAESQGIEQRSKVEGLLSGALSDLFLVVENYPDLKASNNFIILQQSLAEIEDHIQLARRYYNGAARNLNILVESFPSNIIAKRFGFNQVKYFELENEMEHVMPKVEFKQ